MEQISRGDVIQPCFRHTSSLSKVIHHAWPQLVWKRIWSLPLPFKIRFFIWQLCHDRLPVKQNLVIKVFHDNLACPLCHSNLESTTYLFLSCEFVQQVWFGFSLGIYTSSHSATPVSFWLGSWFSHLNLSNNDDLELLFQIIAILWATWKVRGQCVFNGKNFSPLQVLFLAKDIFSSLLI
ncbi:unnamed protein product [Camellia sinensis]